MLHVRGIAMIEVIIIRQISFTETVLESGAVDSSRYRKGKGDIRLKWLLWTERICVLMEKACKKCKYNQFSHSSSIFNIL